MKRLSPRFRSQQFFLCKICGETFYPEFYRDLYGDAPNRAAGNQQKHLSLSFATKA